MKSIVGRKRYYLLVFFAAVFCMTLFSSYLILNAGNQKREIENAKDTYGDFHYAYLNVNPTQVEKIKASGIRGSYTEVGYQVAIIHNQGICVNYLDEDIAKHTNIRLVEGTFPKVSNQIAVEKWFMIQLGYSTDDIIGKELQLETGNTVQNLVVSGIVSRDTSSMTEKNEDDSQSIIIRNANTSHIVDGVNIYVQCKNSDDIDKKIEKIQRISSEIEAPIILNSNLLFAEGSTSEAKQIQKKNEYIIAILHFLLSFFILITISNIFDLWIVEWKNSVYVLKILGIPMNLVRNIICCFSLLILTSGLLVGALGGILSVQVLQMLLKDEFLFSVPWNSIIIQNMVIIVFSEIIIGMKTLPMLKCTSSEFLEYANKKAFKDKQKPVRSIFSSKRGGVVKLSLRNINYYGKRKLFLCFCITVSIMLIFLSGTQLNSYVEFVDNNNQFDYRLEVNDYWNEKEFGMENDVVKMSDEIKTYCNKNQLTLCEYNACFVDDFEMKKSWLSEAFRLHLEDSAMAITQLHNMNQYIYQDLVIMGYSDDMFHELLQKNKIKDTNSKNTAVILDRTVNRNQTMSYDILPDFEENIGIDSPYFKYSSLDEDAENVSSEKIVAELNLLGKVSSLPLYPENEGNYLCIIMRQKDFKEYFCYDANYPGSFYLKEGSKKQIRDINNIVSGTDFFKIFNQKENYRKERENYFQSIFLYCALFVLCTICVLMNLVMIHSYEIKVRRDEYFLLRSIGISKEIQSFLSYLEIIWVFLVGIFWGIVFAKVGSVFFFEQGILTSKKLPEILSIGCWSVFGLGALILLILVNINLTKITNYITD